MPEYPTQPLDSLRVPLSTGLDYDGHDFLGMNASGEAVLYDAGEGHIPLGFAQAPHLSPRATSGIDDAIIPITPYHIRLPIEDLAGDDTDRGKPVYAEDHKEFHLDDSDNGNRALVGFVYHPDSATEAWVTPLVNADAFQHALVPTRFIQLLGTIPLSGTDATVVHRNVPMPRNLRLKSTRYATVEAPAGASAVGEIQILRVPGGTGTPVAVTGGEVAVATGAGDLQNVNDEDDGAAITGTNDFTAGDHCRIQNVVTDAGTFSGGLIEVYGTFETIL